MEVFEREHEVMILGMMISIIFLFFFGSIFVHLRVISIINIKLHRNMGTVYGGLRQSRSLGRKVSEADLLIANVELRVYVL